MRSLGVVMAPPILDQYLGFFQRIEDLAIEQLIAQLAIKDLDVAVFPGAAFLNEQRSDIQASQPVADALGGELRTIVGADVGVTCPQSLYHSLS